VLVVPADLPLLQAEDVASIVTLGRYPRTVVLAPDRREEGTNLLFVRPPGLIPYAFGGPSFEEHQRLAREAGATLHIYRSERAGLDLDVADDLFTYYRQAELLGETVIPHQRPEQVLSDPQLSSD
jgi:2-phospho-L-lactate guanylyltransferase (CobY/MobA/RfbA family)